MHLLTINVSLIIIIVIGSIATLGLVMWIIYSTIKHKSSVGTYETKITRMTEEQEQLLLKASVRMQEEERQRLAADLHDDAGPLLATIRLYLNENLVNQDKATQLQTVLQARQVIDDAILLVRNISHNLMPPTLKNFGLGSAVQDMFQKISASGTMNASCRFHDYEERLAQENELILFRIIQELINNILKHSNAQFIHLTQNMHGDRFFIRIHHDGKGLLQTDYEKLNRSAKSGLGLKNINSRLQLIRGAINFEKDISQSFYKVTIELPFEHMIE
jgi:two-component system, NarL family, sensor kinase